MLRRKRSSEDGGGEGGEEVELVLGQRVDQLDVGVAGRAEVEGAAFPSLNSSSSSPFCPCAPLPPAPARWWSAYRSDRTAPGHAAGRSGTPITKLMASRMLDLPEDNEGEKGRGEKGRGDERTVGERGAGREGEGSVRGVTCAVGSDDGGEVHHRSERVGARIALKVVQTPPGQCGP